MKHFTFFLVFFFFVNQNYSAQQNLDTYFDHLFDNKKMMGSIAISHKDSIVYSKQIGYSNAETKKMIDENTKFRVASITKTYTAVLILKAIEEQKLKLKTKLSSYYPQIKNAEKITIEQLLKHRTGIYNFTEKDDELDWEKNFHSQDEFINYVLNEKSNFKPGTQYEYSNTNYALLGFILEKIYQKSYAEILDEKIAKPLNLKNTYYSFEIDETKNEALSYNIQDNYLKNTTVNYSNHPGSGGITSTPREVNKFLSAVFEGKLISAKTLEMMLPKKAGEYGFGIIKLGFTDVDAYEHTGRVENFISEYWYFPKQRLGFVCLTNAVNIDTTEIMNNLVGYAYQKSATLKNYKTIDEMSEDKFSKIKGTYRGSNKKESITISSNGKKMTLQASEAGQIYFTLQNKGNNTFQSDNVKLTFHPEKEELIFTQEGITEIFKKQL
ncbi:serine hydrolase domain-containing protein [Epilithonimonas xixisoli]|uniref:D-alanyl-D-alanine carboxypeptidase n=1 Tax=Epilithonimonas xixisoli TaxID=1476462 RepID=A0A4R8IJ90_9FLAO|nr:serine hydrolase domain-containing protein [Epilithonimonas xixisoli]TDX87043.1 D-alanyl-D-alanine carboxypeptidase [Epilithonimonas xixisoli]